MTRVLPNLQPFLKFIHDHSSLKLSLIFSLIFLLLLPSINYYNQIDLVNLNPVVRLINHKFLPLSDYPVNLNNVLPPTLTARGIIVIDADSKAILYQRNPDLKLLPASTTKIMTALIVLDQYDLSDTVTIGSIDTDPINMELEVGEIITIENLLYGLLVGSANDAAIALAQHHPQGQSGFIIAMNQKAKDLHLSQTQFTNPVGFDDFGHYTTVHDLALLTAHALENHRFKKIVSTINLTVSDIDNTIIHELENINQLLGQVPGLDGVKTGFTQLAGECLVTSTKRENHHLITVVLNSQDRFQESASLINWVFSNFTWQKTLPAIH